MKFATTTLLLAVLVVLAAVLSAGATRGNSNTGFPPGFGAGIPGFGGPGGFPGMPGFGSGNGWAGGYGGGYSGPNGGRGFSGVSRPSTVCKTKGCYNKKMSCPAKCFYAYSRSGRNYGSGGGGGGCTLDCNKCTAYC